VTAEAHGIRRTLAGRHGQQAKAELLAAAAETGGVWRLVVLALIDWVTGSNGSRRGA
jgi:hypothetical protein